MILLYYTCVLVHRVDLSEYTFLSHTDHAKKSKMIDEDYQPISISVFLGFAIIAAFVLIVLCLFVLVVYVWLI